MSSMPASSMSASSPPQLGKFSKALLEELVALGCRANDGAENLNLAVRLETFASVSNPVGDPILIILLLEA